MNKENQWNKIKPTHQELEVFEIVKSQFVGELKIVRESVQGKWDYYIQYDYNGHKGSLNNYPFPSLKYCKEFVEEYEEYITQYRS